jgi:thioredoxin-related protein
MLQRLFFPLAAFLLMAAAVPAQTTPAAADVVLQHALQQAGRENKKAFIIFHASWCGWCHRMDSLMKSPACNKLFTDNYVIEHITILEPENKKNLENPGGEELYKKYHGEGMGIPYWLIFDATGKLLADSRIRPANAAADAPGENTGCPAAKDEVDYFISVLKITSSLNAAQLQTIEKTFWMK